MHEATPWAASIVADMRVTILDRRDLALTLEMQPHSVQPNSTLKIAAQAVDVAWNGRPLGTCQFVAEEGWTPKTFSFDVPEHCQTLGANTLTFASRYAVSARHLYGEGNDERSHAFGLIKLTMTPKGAPLPTQTTLVQPKLVFTGEAVEQHPRSRLSVPVRLPESGTGRLSLTGVEAVEGGASARIFLRYDTVSGPLEKEIMPWRKIESSGEPIDYQLDEFRAQYVELVFDVAGAPVNWVAPTIQWDGAPIEMARPEPATVETPYQNVVLIVLDAFRGDSAAGNGHYRTLTPHIDAAANEGVLYRHAYAAVPFTYCSTWTICTGLYPFQHGGMGGDLAPGATKMAETLQTAGITTGLISANPLASHTAGYIEFMDAYEDLEAKPEGDPNLVTDKAVDFLQRHADKRFFLHLHYRQPHGPYRATEDLFQTLSYDPTGRLAKVAKSWIEFNISRLLPDREQAQELRARYDENIKVADTCVGQILDCISSLELDEKTAVIITSDHGEAFGEHDNVYTHTLSVYNSVLHIPMILHGKDIRQLLPNEPQTVASLIDVYPTVCDLMGLPAPALLPGQSLVKKAPVKDAIVAFAQAAWLNEGLFTMQNHWGEAFYWSNYKLIRDNGNQRLEVYDLSRDPGEKTDLASVFPVRANYLLAHAEAWKADQARFIQPTVELTDEIPDTAHLRALGYF